MDGLLLINLGTPDAPEPAAVRRYLREFLWDHRVVDIAPVRRWLLLNLFILPFRPKQSAEAYAKVWTDRGSPLLFHSEDLADGVRARLGSGWHVELAMRYGKPEIPAALSRLVAAGVDRIVVLPLYPQYASSSTGSSLEVVYADAARREVTPSLSVVPPFFDDPGFIGAAVDVARPVLDGFSPDHVLFSFHGLPERQIRKSDPTGNHCLAKDGCCDAPTLANRGCYRFQSYETARAMAAGLGLGPMDGRWSVSFQSRLGSTPWIKPYTDQVIPVLVKNGVKRLAVLCPSFVADCLETLEEIGMRAKEQFEEAGGEELVLVPCVNSAPAWIDAVTGMVLRAVGPAADDERTARLGVGT
jgi:protoporphyrin/coproporphyrin ferrochelatase